MQGGSSKRIGTVPHRGLKFEITDEPRRDGAEQATDAAGMPTDGPDDLPPLIYHWQFPFHGFH